MVTRYRERRRYIRVPASGPVRWTSGTRSGGCQLVDISPGGAGLRMTIRKAAPVGTRLSLLVDLSPGETWHLSPDARVVRRVPADDGHCLVGVEFTPGQ